MIERAKQNFIKNSLNRNVKNPKRFWRIINDMIKIENSILISDVEFINNVTMEPVQTDDVPNFLNEFF